MRGSKIRDSKCIKIRVYVSSFQVPFVDFATILSGFIWPHRVINQNGRIRSVSFVEYNGEIEISRYVRWQVLRVNASRINEFSFFFSPSLHFLPVFLYETHLA